MKKETRTICYDEELRIEAYHFEGITQSFPIHFHEHYVIGFLEEGERRLSCRSKERNVRTGEVVLFSPHETHACTQVGNIPMDFRGLNITPDIMKELTEELTGKAFLPAFTGNVVLDEEISCCLKKLHGMVMDGSKEFEKEELLLFLLSEIIEKYSEPFENTTPDCCGTIENLCTYMESHYTEHLSLEDLCKSAGLSKSTLLRAFTKYKGITPYRYLQTIKINKAKELMEQGISPVDAALRTGFSDQSHFNRFFTRC